MFRDQFLDAVFARLGRVTVGGALVGSLLLNLVLLLSLAGLAVWGC
ncbi:MULTISPECIES: hypothetical protein [Diaphorobacter]|nr:hypothetical protein [Diaphorobacter nitroreducens]UOB04703.1 hypothetical protein MRB47_14925 [Diaphorobacter sp. LI3]